ncbi:MAG TPA: acyl-CoA carboxylase epsilon subunit [Dermatophilaceae bacterium]
MADNTSRAPLATQLQDTTATSVRLVRGDASPEELAALVAVLASASGDGAQDPADGPSTATGRSRRLPWGSPGRMTRRTPPHGPGGWRASTLPR